MDGELIWSVSIGKKFVGKNGSFDGPLSTPLIFKKTVFAFSPLGNFFAVDLETGEIRWQRDLKDEEGATLPMYGFTSSPIVAGGNVVLQLGAEEKSLAAFDPITGKTVWAVGDDMINSQTPIATNVNGREIILAAGGKYLQGVDPKTGQSLFKYEHQGGNGSAMTPVPIGGNRFLLTLDDRFSKAVELRAVDKGFNASEAWQQPSIKNTYNIPVVTGGNLYAYSTRILTCVDPETGRAKWKNRKPGDGFLIAVNGHLIIATKKGGLHLAVASPEKYTELSRLKLFKDLVWSIPSYQKDAVYCRSLGELACVDIVSVKGTDMVSNTKRNELKSAPMRGAAEVVEGLVSPKLKQLATDLKQKEISQKDTVSEFLNRESTFPLTENELVTFVFRSGVDDVAVASDIFGARQERKMSRLGNTDLYYLTARLPKNQRANYCFLVNYQPQLDPLNKSRTITSSVYAGEMEFAMRLADQPPLKMSWFGMPEFEAPKYLDFPKDGELAGQLSEETFEKDKVKAKYKVYLPPSYENGETRFPVMYVFGGSAAIAQGDLIQATDQLFKSESGKGLESIVVCVDSGPDPSFAKLFAEKIVPAVDKKYRTRADRNARLLVGYGFTSAGPILSLSMSPQVFGGVSVHSPLLFADVREAVVPAMKKLSMPATVRVEWGRFDMFNPHENWDIRQMSREFADTIKSNSKLNVIAVEVPDSTDWSSWRNRYHEQFRVLHEMSK